MATYEEEEALRRLNEIAMRGNVTSLMQLLDENPLLLDRIIVNHCGCDTPLHIAAMLGNSEFVREILDRKMELALEVDGKGCLPLHLAAVKGYLEIVKMLVEVEPHLVCKRRDDLGRTPLHLAVMKGRDEIIHELLRADIDSARILTHRGETILHLAVKSKHLDTLKLLLLHGEICDLFNSKDSDGNTILHLAVAQKQIETIKYLVGKGIEGADINIKNATGLTPLDLSLALQCRFDSRDMEITDLLGNNKVTTRFAQAVTTTMTKKKKKDDWVNDVRSGLMVVASLIATEAFQAGLTPAGGLWQDTIGGQHKAGQSIMGTLEKKTYRRYLVFNTISFISSLSIILLLISGIPLKKRLIVWTLMAIMWVACISLTLTYCESILFEVPDLTPFEDTIGVYTIFSVGVIVAIVLLGNFLRLGMWLVKNHAKAKQTTIRRVGYMKALLTKKLSTKRNKRGTCLDGDGV